MAQHSAASYLIIHLPDLENNGSFIDVQESAGAIKVCLAVESEEALLSFRDQARRAGILCSYLLLHVHAYTVAAAYRCML